MMQVSSMYAQTLERQLVSRRSQLIHNFSRSSCGQAEPMKQKVEEHPVQQQAPKKIQQSQPIDIINRNNINRKLSSFSLDEENEMDPKECTDRLCRLPSQCRGGHMLGSPRRHSSPPSVAVASRLSQSTGNIPDLNLLKKRDNNILLSSSPPSSSPILDKKAIKKAKEKEEKAAKKAPSNFMMLTPWFTKHNCDKILSQVRSGDIMEFNIKFHHHWGIAILPKNKPSNLSTIELCHLLRDKDGRQRCVRQHLKDYWTEGVTGRINNSRDVHKPPLAAGEVTSTALKLIVQPYRVWQNSEQMVVHCRYGEGQRARQLSDAARWGSLSKCVGLWLTLTSNSTHTSPTGSPKPLRQRTVSVNF